MHLMHFPYITKTLQNWQHQRCELQAGDTHNRNKTNGDLNKAAVLLCFAYILLCVYYHYIDQF